VRLVGSLVVHAVVGAVLFTLARHPAPPTPAAAVAIEVVDLGLPPAPVTTIDVTVAPDGSPGGGGAAATARADEPARTSQPRISEPKRTIVASREASRWGDRARRADSAPTTDPATTDAFDDPRGAITFDDGTGASGDGEGNGKGRGRRTGNGIGFGDGGGIEAGAPPPPPPPAPKLSKARPARLIFPSRQRDVDDGELYIMRVTVDADGYVSGATLVRGFGGHRDDVASAQIWRFRYDPARDDDGQPVRSVLEQRFLVQ
jgi:hypothetical protein